MLKPRYYQEDAFNQFIDYSSDHPEHNPLIVLPTGSGKSYINAMIIQDVISFPKTRVLCLTHQKDLIQQNLEEYLGVVGQEQAFTVGVYSAGLKSRDTDHRIIFAGIQSVHKRAYELGRFDLIIIDEVHRVPVKSEGTYRKFLDDMKKINKRCMIVGLSATPYRLKGGLLCDPEHAERIFHEICHETTMTELMDAHHKKNRDKKQYLCPLISKNSVNRADMSGVTKTGGEYNAHEMELAFNKSDLVACAVREIKELASDRKKILVFTTGINHCEAVTQALRDVGFTAACIHSQKLEMENDQIKNDFKEGKTQCLVNVDILCLDEQTEILTSDGFVGIDDMTMEHKIAAWKADGDVEFTPPKTIVRRERFPYEKMVSYGSESSSTANIRVTSNHRMVTYGYDGRINVQPAIETTKSKTGIKIPAFANCKPDIVFCDNASERYRRTTSQHISSTKCYHKRRGFSDAEAQKYAEEQVESLRNMEYKSPHELTLAECRFIGFWLGDGTISGGRVSLAQSYRYPDNIDFVNKTLNEIPLHHTVSEYEADKKSQYRSIRWNLSRGTGGYGQRIENGFFPYELYLKKEGTRLFLNLTKEQLENLLFGFWKADGLHHSKHERKKSRTITGTQKALYDILQEACSLRGISAIVSMCSKPKNPRHKQQYRFIWGGRKCWNYNAKTNITIEHEFKKERVWCVTSSTSYLICRRNGKVFITGNTTGYNVKNIDCIAMLRSTLSPGLYVQIAGRGTRLHEDKENCLFLDFGGNILRHGCVDKIEIQRNNGKKGGGKVGTVPMKECPQCHNAIHLSVKICPECGYEYPEEEAKHDKEASNESILSGWKAPITVDVKTVCYSAHEKQGKRKSLRVDYYYNEIRGYYSEWVCLEHDGFAKKKAFQWVKTRLKDGITVSDVPTVDQMLERTDVLREPKQIMVDFNEKFPRITGYIF